MKWRYHMDVASPNKLSRCGKAAEGGPITLRFRCETSTHNPLVVGSIPTRPASTPPRACPVPPPRVLCIYMAIHKGARMKAERNSARVGLLVSKWGNSLAVRLPAESARQVGVGDGDTLI